MGKDEKKSLKRSFFLELVTPGEEPRVHISRVTSKPEKRRLRMSWSSYADQCFPVCTNHSSVSLGAVIAVPGEALR